MAVHPLFDEEVLDKLKGVADALLAALPGEITDVVVTLRPGPAGNESDINLQFELPDGGRLGDNLVSETVVLAGREFAVAWMVNGHPMPAFRFTCGPGDDGRRRVTMEPLQEW